MTKRFLILCGLIGVLQLRAGEMVLPELAKTPVPDGRISAEEYAGALFRPLKKIGRGVPENRTEVYFGRRGKYFHAAFICYDSDMKKLSRRFRMPEERDNAIWLDDCIELRFDPWNAPSDPAGQRQIIINPNGIVYDAVGRNSKVNLNCRVQALTGKDFWSVELAVPLAELTGYESGGAELWRIGIFRSHPRCKELQSLTGDLERSFASPSQFETFRSGKMLPERPFTVTGLRDGKLLWRAENASAFPLRASLEQLRIDGRLVGKKESSVLSAAGQEAELPLRTVRDGRVFRLSAPGGYVLEWDVPARKKSSVSVRATVDPLYKELWSETPAGLVRFGSMSWPQGFDPAFLPTALDFGIPWNLPAMLKIVSREKLCLISSGTAMATDYSNLPGLAPPDTKFVAVTTYYSLNGIHAPRARNNRPLLIDPEVRKAWLRDWVEIYRPYADKLFAVHFGDEINEHLEEYFVDLLKTRNEYPAMDRMCRIIKGKYGFGKFGPPESASDPNVYRWIALRSFLHDELIGLHKKLKQSVRKNFPGVFLVSDDPGAYQNKLYDYADFTPEVCDIITNQLYPSRDPDTADFSFICKYIRDLSGHPELHPCFHVENYGDAMSPWETLEKISQGVRAGATGFHWYLADTTGARSGRYLGNDYFGAPERFQAEMAIQREMRSMNQLKFPKEDCGIFTPVTTLRAYPGGLNNRPEKARMLHSLLEIQCGAWFRYFNEKSLSRNLIDLKQLKAVFVPDAKYCTPEAFRALAAYAEHGGTLVISDPDAFSFSPSSEPLERSLLPGLADMKTHPGSRVMKNGTEILPLSRGKQYELVPRENSEVMFRYADGKPAVLRTPFGQGQVIVFGSDFSCGELVKNPEWGKWIRKFAASLELRLDHPIWRFRFPERLIAPEAKPVAGRCLTGNFIFFRNFRPLAGANDNPLPGAGYRCIPEPDAPKETGTGFIPFSKGKLTDRRRAYREGNADGRNHTLNDRITGWSCSGPIVIEFNMAGPSVFGRIELFYHGSMRDVTLSVSSGGSWKKCAFFPAGKDESIRFGVAKKTLKLPAPLSGADRLRLEFGPARDPGPISSGKNLPGYYQLLPRMRELQTALNKANFQLSEIEIWDR